MYFCLVALLGLSFTVGETNASFPPHDYAMANFNTIMVSAQFFSSGKESCLKLCRHNEKASRPTYHGYQASSLEHFPPLSLMSSMFQWVIFSSLFQWEKLPGLFQWGIFPSLFQWEKLPVFTSESSFTVCSSESSSPIFCSEINSPVCSSERNSPVCSSERNCGVRSSPETQGHLP